MLINFQTLQYNFFYLIGQLWLQLAPPNRNRHIIFEFIFRLTVTEWCAAMQQLVYEHSKGPDVSLWAIHIFDQSFRTHVYWRTNVYVFKFSMGHSCESKVSDLCLSVLNENISHF